MQYVIKTEVKKEIQNVFLIAEFEKIQIKSQFVKTDQLKEHLIKLEFKKKKIKKKRQLVLSIKKKQEI